MMTMILICNLFAKPNGSVISDINTGAAYLKTYDALIKNVEEDMPLPCTLAIDKTKCNVGVVDVCCWNPLPYLMD
jgi:hypothetical protein